jgi:hypothetical protein
VLLLLSTLSLSASDSRNTPDISITSLDMGIVSSAGLDGFLGFDVLPNQIMRFSWEAFANHYGGEIVSYRYGFDLVDADDPNDPGWSVPAGIEHQTTSEFSFNSGIHNLVIECDDDFENKTRFTFQLYVILIPSPEFKLPLLLIDDVVDRNSNDWLDESGIAHDNDIQRDSRWIELIGDVLWFDPDRDIIDLEETPNLSLADLVNYEVVIWATSKNESSFISQHFSPVDDSYNWLQKYQQYCGNLLLTGTGATSNFHPTEPHGLEWIHPIIYDSIEPPSLIGPDLFALSFSTFQDLDFNMSPLGLETYPYKSLGLSMMDIIIPDWSFPDNSYQARQRKCAGTKAVLLDQVFADNYSTFDANLDTVMNWDVIDWLDTQYDIPDINLVYNFGGNDEFYNADITSREVDLVDRLMPDGSPMIEPMWQLMTRYDSILQQQIDAGNTSYPDFNPIDVCGCAVFEDGTGIGSLNKTLMNSAILGFVTHTTTLTKPSGLPDVVWGFDPTKLEPVAMRKSVQWVLGELFGLDVTVGIAEEPEPTPDIPDAFVTKLWPCYPNPFNPSTTLNYDLHEPCKVNLSIFDAKGRLIATVVSGFQGAGQYSEAWNGLNDNGTSAPSGAYYLKLITGNYEQTQNMSLVK